MEIKDIKAVFENEFGAIADIFSFVDITLDKAAQPNDLADRPGVYVFWRAGSVIKVGRHLTNAKSRALEHIPADTGGEMAKLKGDPACHLLFFTVPKDKYHWAASPEIFLEVALKPAIPSGRLG